MHSEKSRLIESDYRFNYVRKARGGRSCEGGTPGCCVWLTWFLVSPLISTSQLPFASVYCSFCCQGINTQWKRQVCHQTQHFEYFPYLREMPRQIEVLQWVTAITKKIKASSKGSSYLHKHFLWTFKAPSAEKSFKNDTSRVSQAAIPGLVVRRGLGVIMHLHQQQSKSNYWKVCKTDTHNKTETEECATERIAR